MNERGFIMLYATGAGSALSMALFAVLSHLFADHAQATFGWAAMVAALAVAAVGRYKFHKSLRARYGTDRNGN